MEMNADTTHSVAFVLKFSRVCNHIHGILQKVLFSVNNTILDNLNIHTSVYMFELIEWFISTQGARTTTAYPNIYHSSLTRATPDIIAMIINAALLLCYLETSMTTNRTSFTCLAAALPQTQPSGSHYLGNNIFEANRLCRIAISKNILRLPLF